MSNHFSDSMLWLHYFPPLYKDIQPNYKITSSIHFPSNLQLIWVEKKVLDAKTLSEKGMETCDTIHIKADLNDDTGFAGSLVFGICFE